MPGKGKGNNNPSSLSFGGTPTVHMSIGFLAGDHKAFKAFGPCFHCKLNPCKVSPELPDPEDLSDSSL